MAQQAHSAVEKDIIEKRVFLERIVKLDYQYSNVPVTCSCQRKFPSISINNSICQLGHVCFHNIFVHHLLYVRYLLRKGQMTQVISTQLFVQKIQHIGRIVRDHKAYTQSNGNFNIDRILLRIRHNYPLRASYYDRRKTSSVGMELFEKITRTVVAVFIQFCFHAGSGCVYKNCLSLLRRAIIAPGWRFSRPSIESTTSALSAQLVCIQTLGLSVRPSV